jgi:hypothetical protein
MTDSSLAQSGISSPGSKLSKLPAEDCVIETFRSKSGRLSKMTFEL